jgi:hypothetical protein
VFHFNRKGGAMTVNLFENGTVNEPAESVVRRLRKSREKHWQKMKEMKTAGNQLGRKYAEEVAEYGHLWILSVLSEARDDEDGSRCNCTCRNCMAHGSGFEDPNEYWAHALGKENFHLSFDPTFLEAFLEGASEVWSQVEVEDKL